MLQPNIKTALVSVRSLLSQAERLVEPLARHDHGGNDDWHFSIRIGSAAHEAYTHLLIVSEAIGLDSLHKEIEISLAKSLEQEDGLSAIVHDPDGDVHLLAASDLRRFISSLEGVYGLKSSSIVSKDLIDIVRASQYAITDTLCFQEPPSNEAEVHRRIEAVLKCVFPDLDHEPPISKPIKSFRPDTGLPSLRTLIEYKFVESRSDVKRVVDEILADTRGYKSEEWDKVVFVIYETSRLVKESEWNRLLGKCDTGFNIQAIVICGETPGKSGAKNRKTKKKPTRKSTKKSRKG